MMSLLIFSSLRALTRARAIHKSLALISVKKQPSSFSPSK
jgi:hypothetical protein